MNTTARKLIAEFVGTFLLVFLAVGAAVFGIGAKVGVDGTGPGNGIVGVALAFGLVLLAIAYAFGPVSGAHVNPAVTLAMLLGRRMPTNEAVGYWIAQFLGAILGAASVAEVLQPGMHGTTFGGNPVACASGIAVLEEIAEQGLMKHALQMGDALLAGLAGLVREFPLIAKEARGLGLMVALELHGEADPVVVAMRDRGILLNATDKTVLRFVPPLVITEVEIDVTIAALREVFGGMAG